jgi:hypothetical protein
MINILFKTSIPSFQYSIIPFNRLNSNALENSISLIRFRNYDALSLVAKTILTAAIRTCPGDRIAGPQSGHVQVIALQDIPHMFSSMQFWQILNPQRHVQQKGNVILQQTQSRSLRRRRFLRYAVSLAGAFMIVVLNL